MNNVIVCIAKNEDHYIDEWLQYHLKLGFDRIFVYQNNWRYSGKYLNDNKVQLIEFDYNYPDTQAKAYNDFIYRFGSDYDFAAFFDIDEFLTLKKHNNVNEFLQNYSDVDAIGINWRLFGDSGLKEVVNGDYSVLNRFIMCGSKLNKHVKLIVNLKRIDKSKQVIHSYCIHYTLKSVSADSTMNVAKTAYIHGPFNENDLDKCMDIAYLNHYRNKTIQENIERAKTDQTGIFYYNPYLKDFMKNFKEYNFNDIEDLTARDFYLN